MDLTPEFSPIKLNLTEAKSEDITLEYSALTAHIHEKKRYATDARQRTEAIMLDAYRAWRGEYSEEEIARLDQMRARNPFACSAFVKITKTKVQAAFGQVMEILLSDDEFPIGVQATKVPEGISETIHVAPQGAPADIYGYNGDGNDPLPGTTSKLLAGLTNKYKQLFGDREIADGPSPDKAQIPEFHPAEESAYKMNKVIQDQLSEGNARFVLEAAAYEMVMLGTGVIKGPFTDIETVHDWQLNPDTKEIEYQAYEKLIPRIEHVSCWDLYPDPEATSTDDCEFIIQRHLLSRSQVLKLNTQPMFDKKAIKRLLDRSPGYSRETWENILSDNSSSLGENSRYEVLEYWGTLDAKLIKELGLPIDVSDNDDLDAIQVNVWIAGNEVLRVVVNPFKPQRIPYCFIPYETHPYQLWGVGVPENMADSQELMNGHIRMAIDNLNLAGNMILEVNESRLAPGQDFSMYPGKVFRTIGGQTGQSVYSLNFNNTAPAHIQMYDKARQLSDEETGLPSYAHGQTGVSGMSRTAAGMSMLMSAAALNIKTVVKNIDRYGLEPLGNAYFQWNMQFNKEVPEIRGDLKIQAKGTSSLMQKEVQTQRLLSLIQVAANPLMAPFLNAEYVFKQIAISMSLDPEKVVNDPKVAALYAEIMGKIGNGTGQDTSAGTSENPNAGSASGSSQAVGGINPSDGSGGGGGNIGVGSPPSPGQAGFSG